MAPILHNFDNKIKHNKFTEMKNLLLVILAFIFMSFVNRETNFTTAKQNATEQHKLILLNFSGSDWCGPCIMLRKEIFENETFRKFSDTSLILLNADFPRQKKNQLSKEEQKLNGELADIYNKKGIFPMTLLLSADGKIIKSWEGKPKEKTGEFIQEIKTILDTRK